MKCMVCDTDILYLELVEVTGDAGLDGHKMSIGLCQNEECCQIYYDIKPLDEMLKNAVGKVSLSRAATEIS